MATSPSLSTKQLEQQEESPVHIPEIISKSYENEKELDEIRSRINGVNVTIVHGDIRATFDFSVRDECYHTNCFGHNYDKKQLWTTIKATGQPSSVPFPINKKM
nr:hypothetical protein Iba_chr08fCG1300 [Ipomoea batatas]